MHRLARKRQMALGHFSFNEEQYPVSTRWWLMVAEVDGMDVVLVRDQIHEIENFHILRDVVNFLHSRSM